MGNRLRDFWGEYGVFVVAIVIINVIWLVSFYFHSDLSFRMGRIDAQLENIHKDLDRSSFVLEFRTNIAKNYKNWECVGDSPKTCFEDNPLLASNAVAEYISSSGEEVLLMWWKLERSGSIFSMHGQVKSYQVDKVIYRFYEKIRGEWRLLETKSFLRDDISLGEKVPLFESDSLFGRKFFQFHADNGYEYNEIKIPTMTFR